MKIAVTTANGHLGSSIIKHLIQELGKEQVIGIARTPQKAEYLGVEIRQGDYDNIQTFEKSLKGVEAVLIVSSNGEPKHRIEQHRNVIEAAKSNGVKKIVYTSILGNPEETAFAPVISSNRQTEEDIQNSGLTWAIGRNSLYLEPDLEYMETYQKTGEIANCAGEGKCTYTTRSELAVAYAKMLLEDKHDRQIYNLGGEGVTQTELAETINQIYGVNIKFKDMSVEDYLAERKEALGDFLGTIIAGIYEGIRNGAFEVVSDFEKASGRKHKSLKELMKEFKENE